MRQIGRRRARGRERRRVVPRECVQFDRERTKLVGLRFGHTRGPPAHRSDAVAQRAQRSQPDPHLHQHPARGDASWPACDADSVAAHATFRSERQTFIPVPDARQAVFTIHVETMTLHEAVTRPGAATRLHSAIASMSPAVLAYRGLDAVRAPLLEWLGNQPGEATSGGP